ncbi:potassium/proton antiporter [Fusobacterium perfoetens]|uniref:potassium/proton antiporter n=1 Tax=Fusobacterium perfoetens TaxID=852 RepID=UPI0015A38395|nr:potassium/proton antiporter [Fusobacterium perfoetens]MCF2625336.1 potassium/proton antiporter [Fusobacterium perfoetens]
MEYKILICGILLFFSLCSIRIARRAQVPLLIMFLFIGIVAGSEGIGGIYFDDFTTAQNIGNFALLFILFSGALETKKIDALSALYPSGILATLGVFLTAVIAALFTYFLTNFSMMESLIFGAFVSSTDAAAVMSILGESKLKKRIRTIIEIESGSNDPMAYALILFFLSMYKATSGDMHIFQGIIFLIRQIVLGLAFGALFGKITVPISRLMQIKREEFMIIHIVSFLFICFSLTTILKGNGFLAIYIMGIFIGNERFEYRINFMRNMRVASWLMQITMFIILGLLVFPSQLLSVIIKGSILAILIIIVGRFIVVYLVLIPFKLTGKEKFFISWAGLKGAVPIIFSIFAVSENLDNAQMMFNMIFYMVVFSVILQGMTLKHVAKWLGLLEEESHTDDIEVEVDELEELAVKKLYLTRNSEYANKQIKELHLSAKMHIISVKRGDSYLTPNGSLELLPGDQILFSMR